MRSIFAVILFIAWQGTSDAQIDFKARTSVKNVTSGQIFELTYSLEGGKIQDFRPPDFSPFKVIGGPNQSSQTTIINGHMTSSVSYGYSLLASEKGVFSVPPAQVNVKGKWYKSNTLSISVNQDTGNTDPTNIAEVNDIFITIDISSDTAYVGQQIIVDYILYSNVQTRGTDILSEPEFDDFYVQYPRLFPRHAKKLTINDRMYESKIIRRMSIFPQFPGVYTLDQVNARVRVLLEGNANSRRSIFSLFERTKPVMVLSPQDTIVVLSVPSPSPQGFVGAVGDYRVKPFLTKKNIKKNDAFSLRLDVRGNGDNKKILAPELNIDDAFVVYEPKLIEDEVTEFQGEVSGSKIFEYVIVPKEEGRFELPLKFSYFDPDIPDFVQGEFPPLVINVGTGQDNDQGESILFDENIQSENTENSKISPWLIPAAGGFLTLGTLAFLFLKKKSEESDVIIEEIDWDEKAKKYLVTAKDKIEASDGTLFYESLRHGVYGYVAQKLKMPLSELTKQRVIDILHDSNVEAEIIEALSKIISSSEMALFAGVDDISKRSELYHQGVHILGNLERHFRG